MMKTWFEVVPRYTSGSPAFVDERTALRVALQERQAHARMVSGIYGSDVAARAQRKGLDGIVRSWCETRGRIEIHDLITRRRYSLKSRGTGLLSWPREPRREQI